VNINSTEVPGILIYYYAGIYMSPVEELKESIAIFTEGYDRYTSGLI